MSEGKMSADLMGVAALTDPQFSIPLKPRIPPSIVVMEDGKGGLLFEGGPTRQVLGGAAATTLLPAIIPLIDGTKTIDEIIATSGLDRRTVFSTIALLYSSGVLEDGAIGEDNPEVPEEIRSFYSRSIDSTRVNPSGATAIERLTASTVVVVYGDGSDREMGESLGRALKDGAVGAVTFVDSSVQEVAAAQIEGSSLMVAVGIGEDIQNWAKVAGRLGVRVIPVIAAGSVFAYGPCIDPRITLEFEDLAKQLSSWETLPLGTAPSSITVQFATSLVAGEITAILSRVGTTAAYQSIVAVNFDDWNQRRLVPASTTEDGIPLAHAFTISAAFAPRSASTPRDHQVHYKEKNLVLQRESKEWPSARTIALPAEVTFNSGGPKILRQQRTTDRIGFFQVADTILRAFGNRAPVQESSKVERWASTGGNLGSAQVYLIARDVDGIDPGVYGFQRNDDTLAELPWADPFDPIFGLADSPCVLVQTADVQRVATKYHAFAWRIVHLDAGSVMAQARLLAAEHGIVTECISAWNDDGIASALGIDQDLEPITAVITMSPNIDQNGDPS